MENLQPCPNCLSDVDVIRVNHASRVEEQFYFFVHCNECGKGTSKAYPSISILTAIWNALAFDRQTP
jgi:uncharacterized Zn finger protein